MESLMSHICNKQPKTGENSWKSVQKKLNLSQKEINHLG